MDASFISIKLIVYQKKSFCFLTDVVYLLVSTYENYYQLIKITMKIIWRKNRFAFYHILPIISI